MSRAGAVNVDALILAGGEGRRLARGEKALAALNGQPLVAHVMARIRPQVRHLAVSANRCHAAYRQLIDCPLVSDAPAWQGCGPLAGMAAGLEHFSHAEWVLMVPCDTPLLPTSLVAELLAFARPDRDVVYAADGQREHFSVALLRPALLPALKAALVAGTRRLQAFYASQQSQPVMFEDAGAFTNINTAAQLDALSQRLSSASGAH